MKYILFIIVVFLTACGGTLTDEQRKKLKDGMKLNEIKKVSEAQIMETAFSMGRFLVKDIEKISINDRPRMDSLQQVYKIKIFSLYPGDSLLLAIEKQVVEAYTAGSGQVQLNDNVQRVGADSVLYTKPIMRELPDGSVQFSYALGIRIPRKQIVLSIKD